MNRNMLITKETTYQEFISKGMVRMTRAGEEYGVPIKSGVKWVKLQDMTDQEEELVDNYFRKLRNKN